MFLFRKRLSTWCKNFGCIFQRVPNSFNISWWKNKWQSKSGWNHFQKPNKKGGNVLRVEDPPPMWIYIFSCVSLRLIFIMSMSPPHHPLGGGEVDLCPGIFDGASFIPRVSPRVIHNSATSNLLLLLFSSLRVSCCQMSFDAGQHLKAGRLFYTNFHRRRRRVEEENSRRDGHTRVRHP